jgi:hypothetical protein
MDQYLIIKTGQQIYPVIISLSHQKTEKSPIVAGDLIAI